MESRKQRAVAERDEKIEALAKEANEAERDLGRLRRDLATTLDQLKAVEKQRDEYMLAAGAEADGADSARADLKAALDEIDDLRAKPEREKLSEDDRKFYAEMQVIEPYPMARLTEPRECRYVTRFMLERCVFCQGVHDGRCPAVKVVKYWEAVDAQERPKIREVVYRDEFDDSGIIWATDIWPGGVPEPEPQALQEAK